MQYKHNNNKTCTQISIQIKERAAKREHSRVGKRSYDSHTPLPPSSQSFTFTKDRTRHMCQWSSRYMKGDYTY